MLLQKLWRTFRLYNMSPVQRGEYLRKKMGMDIGPGCEIYYGVQFGSEPYLIRLGEGVRITSGVEFVTHDGGMWTPRKMGLIEDEEIFGRITIGDNVHIGKNAVIMPGVTVGKNCVIGCGAVVTKDIPEGMVAVGVPARPIETIEEYCRHHKDEFVHTKKMTPAEKKAFLLKRIPR